MSNVRDFYKNEHVLITGGTGFLGKLLISKLLISCPEIKKITLLIRKKGGNEVNARLKTLFDDVIFDELKKQVPEFQEKIELVEGDCEQKHLGLSQMDRFQITQNVSIVFYCAANVEFTNDLKSEVIANVYGATEVLHLIKYVRNLKVFIYVSSSFSNCHLPVVEEKFYEPNIHYKTLLKLTETDFLNNSEQYILGNIPSTYFYSKAAAEQAIREEGSGLPIAVFRPSAILSTWKEPVKGWTDKAFAPTAVMKSIALGQVSAILASDDVIIDMVPGDFTANALIAIAWDVHNRYINNRLDEPRVYNYISMMDNPLKFKSFTQQIYKMVHQKPSEKATWYPVLTIQNTRFENRFASVFRPWLMSFALQCWGRILGYKKLDLLKHCRLYEKLMDLVDSFIQRPHIYLNDNVQELWQSLDETDQQTFPFHMKLINWETYLKVYYDGILKYLIRETNRNEDNAHKHYMKLQTLHSILKVFLYSMAGVLACLVFFYIFW
ncbi:fatty acyl-CoA reductase wat-like [Planococcus citri]|uniref:fatty acyl-CoA reductase wat-like n=1 Tax=Planococcus citri TaxID=170843 RepID=UPI0031F778B4